jgi:pyridoxamine 5'-phosphate oxidase family protein
MTFTPAELDYLRSQPLGRLATVDADGVPQVNPVGFRITSSGDVLIGGLALPRPASTATLPPPGGRRW